MAKGSERLRQEAIAADRTLLLRCMVLGFARWEPFTGQIQCGEVCVGGLRYTTQLDEDECPLVLNAMRGALEQQLGDAHRIRRRA